jgi:hypothetical protein
MFVDFTPLENLYVAIERLNDNGAWLYSFDDRIKGRVIDMNTEDQLYDKGIDSLGRSLGDYAPFTVEKKKAKGQRYDHITLNDTGAFYDSWVVVVSRDAFTIDADDSSLYDEPLFQVWGNDVAGLTDENMDVLRDYLIENYLRYISNELL